MTIKGPVERICVNIVIAGAGKLGAFIAKRLSLQQYNVVLVDTSSKTLEKVARTLDVGTSLGSATDWHILDNTFESDKDVFIAVTDTDETNLLACSIAKALGFQKTIARIKKASFLDRSRIDFAKVLAIDHFIGVDFIIAQDIFRRILYPGAVDVKNFVYGAVQLQTMRIPPNWAHTKVKIKDLDLARNVMIALVERKKELIFPQGDDYLEPLDEVTILGESISLVEYAKFFGTKRKQVSSCIMYGSSGIARIVASYLLEENIRLKILEPQEETCQRLAELLPDAVVINKDPLDPAMLSSERLSDSDVFISVTESTEKNIITSSLAKLASAPHAIALVHDNSYDSLLQTLHIEYAVSERLPLIDRIDAMIHSQTVVSMASLAEDRAKVVEIKVSDDAQLIGKPLKELQTLLPKKFLIAIVENKGKVFAADENTIIAPGDSVVLVTAPENLTKLDTLF